jgi:hypothetical protein
MIHITYTGWVAIFCFLQIFQLGLCIWLIKNQRPIDKEEIVKRISDQNIKLNALVIKTMREVMNIPENQAGKVDV